MDQNTVKGRGGSEMFDKLEEESIQVHLKTLKLNIPVGQKLSENVSCNILQWNCLRIWELKPSTTRLYSLLGQITVFTAASREDRQMINPFFFGPDRGLTREWMQILLETDMLHLFLL